MLKAKCPICNNNMDYDELCSSSILGLEMVYCPECGYEGELENGIVSDRQFSNDDDIPVGCNTCGNATNYPNCKWSCPMFDE